MNFYIQTIRLLLLCLITSSFSSVASSKDVASSTNTIIMHKLNVQPVLDGDAQDWTDIAPAAISLKKINPNTEITTSSVIIKGGIYNDKIYFYLEWEDSSEDVVHKPWVWDENQQKYVRGPQREDRLALQFAMKGDYSTNWFSGNSFTADMWHWKASRSNPLGLAHDKKTVISTHKLLRASKYLTPEEVTLYINRNADKGDKLYTTKRYRQYQGELMPKYILTKQPQGSVADIKAHGAWRDGKWQLELSRKLITGHDDDIAFPGKGIVIGGIAIFDHSENDDHVISDNLKFSF